MADSTTTNLLLTKPEVGASTDSWGSKVNADLDLVDAIFAAAGTGTSVGLNVGSGKKLKLVGDIIDTNGNELLKVTATASAVNELTLANAATGGAPTLTASGGDTNIGMKLVGKGTGEVTARVNGSDVFNASSNFGFKNRIINGAMVIDQRNAGASVVVGSGAFPVDRWFSVEDTDGALTAEQVEDVPAGFVNSVKITTTTADASLTTTQTAQFMQMIEGFNVSDLGFGSASAQTVTLSFWVKSSLTGTMGGSVRNDSANRSYPFSYTISVANTWEQKSITIAGDTSGTWLTNNGIGLRLVFSLGCGPSRLGTAGAWNANNNTGPTGEVPVIGTLNATWYITGVQLEKGSTATSFDYRPYGTELGLCLRYALMIKNGTNSIDRLGLGSTVNATTVQMLIQHPVAFRAAPTLTTTGTAADYQVYSVAITACNAAPTLGEGSQFNSRLNFITAGGLTGGQVSQCSGANTNAYLLFSAEL